MAVPNKPVRVSLKISTGACAVVKIELIMVELSPLALVLLATVHVVVAVVYGATKRSKCS